MTITVDGTAGITFPQGDTQIVGVGPAFSAYASATQTITSGAITKVAINTEVFDTNSNFNTTTNRFTPTVAGYYQVNGCVRGNGSTTFTTIVALIYKNGAEYKRGQIIVNFNQAGNSSVQISDLIHMNGSTDYLELYGQVSGTGTITFDFTNTSSTSFFSACLVRGA